MLLDLNLGNLKNNVQVNIDFWLVSGVKPSWPFLSDLNEKISASGAWTSAFWVQTSHKYKVDFIWMQIEATLQVNERNMTASIVSLIISTLPIAEKQ